MTQRDDYAAATTLVGDDSFRSRPASFGFNSAAEGGSDYEPVEPAEPYEEPSGDREETSFGRWLIETILLVLVAFALAQGIKTWIVQPYIIPTGSMLPTIQLNDRVLAEKISYRMRTPAYGDIVVFNDPTAQHPQLIKRVIAVGGQTVDVRDGAVFVDGAKLTEPYTHGLPSEPGTVRTPIKIPVGSLWLMGDNRTNSEDSRYFGPQPVSAVKGHAFWIYWPLSRFGALN